MVRIAVAALAGAVILFLWGFVSWTKVPWHAIDELPGEDSVIRAIKNSNAPTGVYTFPYLEVAEEYRQVQLEEHRAGPVGLVVLRAEGQEPMSPMSLAVAFGFYLVTALAAALMLSMAAAALGGYMARVFFVVLLGVFVAAGATMIQWNFMRYPLDYSLQVAADNVVAALLLGLVLAAIIKQPSFREAAVKAVT